MSGSLKSSSFEKDLKEFRDLLGKKICRIDEVQPIDVLQRYLEAIDEDKNYPSVNAGVIKLFLPDSDKEKSFILYSYKMGKKEVHLRLDNPEAFRFCGSLGGVKEIIFPDGNVDFSYCTGDNRQFSISDVIQSRPHCLFKIFFKEKLAGVLFKVEENRWKIDVYERESDKDRFLENALILDTIAQLLIFFNADNKIKINIINLDEDPIKQRMIFKYYISEEEPAES